MVVLGLKFSPQREYECPADLILAVLFALRLRRLIFFKPLLFKTENLKTGKLKGFQGSNP